MSTSTEASLDLRSDEAVVLLGAGASVEAGLPTSNQLSEMALVEADSQEEDEFEAFRKLYRVVAGALLFRASQNGRNPIKLPVNVEDIAEGIALLSGNRHWKFGTLMGQIDPSIMKIESKWKAEHRAKSVAKRLLKVLAADEAGRMREAERLAQQILGEGSIWPSFYGQASEHLLWMCFEQLSKPSKSTDYLLPLARCEGVRSIATLNYDTLIESACDVAQRAYDVGVFAWERQNLTFQPGSLPILKLHGSIDWCMDFDPKEVDADGRPTGPTRITRGSPRFGFLASPQPCVIFGTPYKLRASGPFLELLGRFEAEIARVSRVGVIGYSFADAHINTVLDAWLRRSQDKRMFIASANLFQSWEDQVQFFDEWNPNQVENTGMGASEAITAWCG